MKIVRADSSSEDRRVMLLPAVEPDIERFLQKTGLSLGWYNAGKESEVVEGGC